jgi:hypothetical protein
MLRAAMLVFFVIATATAASAGDGRVTGPARWLLEDRDDLTLLPSTSTTGPATDAFSRFIAYCKHNPVGVKPFVTLLPPDDADERGAQLPTLAFFVRAQGRALVSLTRVRARADAGQDVVMQRTLVSDLLAGRSLSLTVYEDHAISDTAARLMGVGTRLTYRPSGWPVRLELMTSYDLDAGASAYLAVTGVFAAPPLPPTLGR